MACTSEGKLHSSVISSSSTVVCGIRRMCENRHTARKISARHDHLRRTSGHVKQCQHRRTCWLHAAPLNIHLFFFFFNFFPKPQHLHLIEFFPPPPPKFILNTCYNCCRTFQAQRLLYVRAAFTFTSCAVPTHCTVFVYRVSDSTEQWFP